MTDPVARVPISFPPPPEGTYVYGVVQWGILFAVAAQWHDLKSRVYELDGSRWSITDLFVSDCTPDEAIEIVLMNHIDDTGGNPHDPETDRQIWDAIHRAERLELLEPEGEPQP